MNTAPEEFEQLRKLLKLKRYEQPPPGYFNNFSSRIINHLENPTPQGAWANLSQEAPWLQRFISRLEGSPMVAGVFGVIICSLLLGGIVYSQYTDQSPGTNMVSNPDGTVGPSGDGKMALNDFGLNSKGSLLASTNAVFTSVLPDSFGTPGNLNIQPVSFTPDGH
jgi:hypothetical protein